MLNRLRNDFRLTIITVCAACASTGILPFAIYRFLAGQYVEGLVDLAIVVGIAVPAIYALVTGRTSAAAWTIALVISAGCVVAAHLLGIAGLLWAYAVLLIVFFLLDRLVAILLNLVTLLGVVLFADAAFDEVFQRFSFFVSASLVSVYAFVVATRNDQQRRQLEALASMDPLTGAGNRRLLEHELAQAAASAHRGRLEPGLAIMDLDHFKLVNDRYGHEAGDKVLVEFAAILRSAVRKLDRVYRFGGEEFVLLVPATDGRGLEVLVNKIRSQVAERLAGPGGPVTVSIGATQLRHGEHWATWLARADAALYRAKRGGRNRAVVDLLPEAGLGPREVPAGRIAPDPDRRRG